MHATKEEIMKQETGSIKEEIKLICKDCGEPFYMARSNINKHYINRGLVVPKRCQKCRSKKKDLDLLAMPELTMLITLIKERETSKTIFPRIWKDPLEEHYEKLSDSVKAEIIHNWARIRKLHCEIDKELSLYLPYDWKKLELYIFDPKAYKESMKSR